MRMMKAVVMMMLLVIGTSFLTQLQADDSVDCDTFKSCYSSTINYNSSTVECDGCLSCFDAQCTANDIHCHGRASCAYNNTVNEYDSDYLKAGGFVASYGAYSSLNANLSFNNTGYVSLDCYGTRSCANTFITSENSYNNKSQENMRTITINVRSSFGAANSKVISNGNDLMIHLHGYYSGHNMSVDCSMEKDRCFIFCYGHSCKYTTLNCSHDNGDCNMVCGNRYDEACQASSCTVSTDADTYADDIDSQQSDTMVNKINNLIKYYSNFNYAINNTDINSINDNYSNKCKFHFNYTDYTPMATTVVGSMCCFDITMCLFIVIEANNNDVYCDAKLGCLGSRIINASNLAFGGYQAGIYGAVHGATNVVLCQSYLACQETIIYDSKILLCEGYMSCLDSEIYNVEKIIALGYQSLLRASIHIDISNYSHASYSDSITNTIFEIYLLGYDSASLLSIKISGSDDAVDIEKVKIYCQNDACTNINASLLCQAQNIFGISICTLATQAPTTSPTYLPTLIPTEKPTQSELDIYLNDLISILNDATIIFPIILFAFVAPLLIGISKKKHSKKHLNPNTNDLRRLTFLDRVSVYGANDNHFVILFLCLEIYDIYTDIAYLIQLFSYKLYTQFILFLLSMGLSILLNMIIVIYLLKIEFSRNNLFLNWFYRYNGIILTTLLLLSMTDANMIASVITSQIFGHSAFYSPISIDSINNLQISLIFSLIFEHIPQVGIQIYLIFNCQKYVALRYDAVTIAALTLSFLDVIFVTFKIGVWMVIKKNNSNKLNKNAIINQL